MLTLYRRHGNQCAKKADRYWKRCTCPMWVEGVGPQGYLRRSLKTTSWERARSRAAALESGEEPMRGEPVSITQAVKDFLADTRERGLAASSLRQMAGTIEREFLPWCQRENYRRLEELDLAALRRYRASLTTNGPRTKMLKQGRLKELFQFCVVSGWLKENPVRSLSSIRCPQTQTGYFTPEEFDRLLAATERFDPRSKSRYAGRRLRAILLLMRWSGLRVGDACSLERSRLEGDRLLLYQGKTGQPVYVPLPPIAVEALLSVPPGLKPHPHYFFWSGQSQREKISAAFRYSFASLAKLANLEKRAHPHMLRDTFAVEMLLAGVPIEEVSKLLGHSSISITERHYAPWVRARQVKAEASVRRAWLAQPQSLLQPDALADAQLLMDGGQGPGMRRVQ